MTDILSDQQKQYFINRLTDRMVWARQTQKALDMCLRQDLVDTDEWNMLDGLAVSAMDEVRDCIREIARACRFNNDLIEPITSAAWTASKEDA